MIHHSESDNLSHFLTQASWMLHETNFLVYNLQLPHGHHDHHTHGGYCGHGGHDGCGGQGAMVLMGVMVVMLFMSTKVKI